MSGRFRLRPKVYLPQLILSFSLIATAVSLITGIKTATPAQAIDLQPAQIGQQNQIELIKAGQSTQPGDYDKTQTPVQIIIPALKIDLPIQQAEVANGYWQVPTNSAAFGLGSSLPKDLGNTVVFAHSRSDLFAPLKQISHGHRVYLLTSTKTFTYTVTTTQEVDPSEVSVVSPTNTSQLTLYTCSGPLDSKRLVVIAKPMEN